MITNIKIEGGAEIETTQIVCICGKCGHHDLTNATIEFNFREQKVFYGCSQCKHLNEMQFGKRQSPPMPRTRM